MMILLSILAGVVNNLHDMIIALTGFGLNVTDKDLHFWVIGIIGVLVFIFADIIFKLLARWSVSIIAFIYTLTVLTVLVFGVEIEQRITGRGNLEFADIAAGLWGFLVLFGCYMVVYGAVCGLRRLVKEKSDEHGVKS